MCRSLSLVSLLCVLSLTVSADEPVLDLRSIDRTIHEEPIYQNQPHYALFVFGPDGRQRSWLVLDGDHVAYIDRNSDGDLTDPEDRVEFDAEASEKLKFSKAGVFTGMHRFPLGEIHGTKLDFDLWVRNPDFAPTEKNPYPDHLRTWDEHGWINGSLMRSAADGSRSQNPLLLTMDPESAQISRFGGPVSIGLKWGEQQRLEAWPKRFVFDVHLGHRNLMAKDCDVDGFRMTRFTMTEVPESITPVARFEFQSATGKPITQVVQLDQRCCGDTLYTEMTLPENVTSKSAKVSVSVLDWTGSGSEPAEFEVPIREGTSPRSEAVYIMFNQDDVSLNDAVGILRKDGLDVFIRAETLLIHQDGRPAYSIQLRCNDEVNRIATAIGMETNNAAQLAQCHARFEVGLVDAEASLREPETLQRISTLLQQLTNGFVYQTWDRQLAAPE